MAKLGTIKPEIFACDYVQIIVKNMSQFNIISFGNQIGDLSIKGYIQDNLLKDGNSLIQIVDNLYAEKECNTEYIIRFFLIVVNQKENIKNCCHYNHLDDSRFILKQEHMESNRKTLFKLIEDIKEKSNIVKSYGEKQKDLDKILDILLPFTYYELLFFDGLNPKMAVGKTSQNGNNKIYVLYNIEKYIIEMYSIWKNYVLLEPDQLTRKLGIDINILGSESKYDIDILSTDNGIIHNGVDIRDLFIDRIIFSMIDSIFDKHSTISLHTKLIELITTLFFNIIQYRYNDYVFVKKIKNIIDNLYKLFDALKRGKYLIQKNKNQSIIYSKNFNLEKLKYVIVQTLKTIYQGLNKDILMDKLFSNDIIEYDDEHVKNEEKWDIISDIISTNDITTHQLSELYPKPYNELEKMFENHDQDLFDTTIITISSEKYPLLFNYKYLIIFLYNTKLENLYPNKLYRDVIDNYCRGGLTEMLLTIKFLEVANILNITQQKYDNYIYFFNDVI